MCMVTKRLYIRFKCAVPLLLHKSLQKIPLSSYQILLLLLKKEQSVIGVSPASRMLRTNKLGINNTTRHDKQILNVHLKLAGDQTSTSYDIKNKQASHGLLGSAGLKMPKHAHVFWRAILTRKVGRTDLVSGAGSGFVSRSGLHTQDCKSLCAAVTICSTLVNTQSDRHTGSI